LIIQNNNSLITSNITQGTSTVTSTVTSGGTTTSTFSPTFTNGGPSVHELVSGSTTEKIMIFRTVGVNHTFTVPTGNINCDVLMIGGGGGARTWGGAGGAGACIVAINQTLPAGSCVVNVGAGGTNSAGGVNGGDSFIKVGVSDRYRAKGGGGVENEFNRAGNDGGCGGGTTINNDNTTESGGHAVGTNVVTLNDGTTKTSFPDINTTHRYAVMGYSGGNNATLSDGVERGGSGGGIGAAGARGSTGGNGTYFATISPTTLVFRDYFANGGNSFGVLHTDTKYYIGGGAGSYNSYFRAGGLGGGGYDGVENTGSGGNNNGGSGIIIIRYRTQITTDTTVTTTTYTHEPTITTTLSTPTLGTPSIELVRGTQGDSNTDYKIGNYNGDFIVKSSVSGVDTDYIRIVGTSASIFNSTASPQWSTVSDRRIKENIERASYDKCYDTINKLELYRFNYIKELNSINKDKTQLGYIAQEVNDVFPKAVSSYEFNNTMLSIPDLLSIDIAQINYSLYGAVKKLIEINNNKELRLKRLECLLNVEDNGIGSTNVIIIDDTMTSNVVVDSDVLSSNVVIIDDIMSSNVVVIEDVLSSNVVVIEDTMTSNVVVIEDTMSSNVVIEDTMSSNVVIEDTMSSNVVVIEDTMTSNVVIEDTMTSNVVIEDTNNI
jgi:hypothetical protein